MRNLKKLLALVVTLTMLLTFAIPAFAADPTGDTKTCADVGMLLGSGSGVTAEYGATTPARYQAAIMLLRLLGRLDEAKAFTGTDNFEDASKVNAENQAILGYLKANPDCGYGGRSDTTFDPLATITAQEYYKVLLVALGYTQKDANGAGDFDYENTIDFAKSVGLACTGNVDPFTIDALSIATVEALKATSKGGTTTLAEKLVAAGKLDAAKAEAAGLYSAVTTATFAATGAKILTATFNKAVDTATAVFAVTKSSIAVNKATVTWDDAKKVATITLVGKMTAGDYAISVTGLTDKAIEGKVTVTDEKVMKIVFTSTNAVLDAAYTTPVNGKVTATYKVYNQYDEDVTSSLPSGAVMSFTSGKGSITGSNGLLTITNSTAFSKGDAIAVTALDLTSTTFVSTVLTVADAAQVAEITITSVYNSDGATPTVNDGNTYYLLVAAKDQYGNDIPAESIKSGVHVSTSSSVISVDTSSFKTANDANGTAALSFTTSADTAGTATVTIISLTSGKKASFDVTVKEIAAVDTITLSSPTLAVAGETFEVPFAAVDQFGNAVTDVAALNAITMRGATTKFVHDYVNNVTKLQVSGCSAGTVVLTAVTPKNKIAMLTITVVAAPIATSVAGTDISTKIAVGSTVDFGAANALVKDQYGRDNAPTIGDTSVATNYQIDLATSDSGKVSLNDIDAATINSGASVALKGVAKGTATITITLKQGSTVIDSYNFVVTVVDNTDFASYELAAIDKVYAGGADYAKAVTVNGVMADGTKVALPEAGFYTIRLVGNIAGTDYAAGMITASTAAAANIPDDPGESTATVVANVYGSASGTQVITGTVTFTKAAPALTTLVLASSDPYTVEDATNNIVSAEVSDVNTAGKVDTMMDALLATSTDQYGIAIDPDILTNLISNAPNSNNVTTVAAGDTFNVTTITNSGKVIVVKVIVKEDTL